MKELRTMMGWYDDGVGWGGWMVMAVSMVAFWALVVFVVLAIFRSSTDSKAPTSRTRDPLEILDERFARGEIDESEYRARAEVLRTGVR